MTNDPPIRAAKGAKFLFLFIYLFLFIFTHPAPTYYKRLLLCSFCLLFVLCVADTNKATSSLNENADKVE